MGDAILIKGRYDGLPFGSHQIYSKTTNQTIGKTISNRPLLAIFENCAYDLFKDIGLRYTPSQLRLEQTDTVGLNSLFTLSVYQPNHTKLHLASAMLLHLNSFSVYMATL